MDAGQGAVWAIVTGGLATLTSFIMNLRKQNAVEQRTDFQVMNDNLRQQIKDNFKELEHVSYKAARLEALIDQQLPFPRWSKDLKGRYKHVNSAFVRKFLSPIGLDERDVYDKTDLEVMVGDGFKEFVPALRRLETCLHRRPDTEVTLCNVTIHDDQYMIVKWADKSGSDLVGTFGLACLEMGYEGGKGSAGDMRVIS